MLVLVLVLVKDYGASPELELRSSCLAKNVRAKRGMQGRDGTAYILPILHIYNVVLMSCLL